MIRTTRALAIAGVMDLQFMTEHGRDRGSALHRACHLWDEGMLDEDTVDPVIRGRLEQYKRFVDDVKPEYLAIEQRFEHHVYGFSGTPDRIARITGAKGVQFRPRVGILDLKAGAQHPSYGLQLALYEALARDAGIINGVAACRWGLYLSDDAYKLVEYTNREDRAAALACVTLANWMVKHGLAKEEE